MYWIAKKYFGFRVRWWHELNDWEGDVTTCRCYYDWTTGYEPDEKLKIWGGGGDEEQRPGGETAKKGSIRAEREL